jgi:hypothetical protein
MPNDPSAARHPLKRGVLDDHQIVNRLLLKQAAGTGENRFAPADQTVPPREVLRRGRHELEMDERRPVYPALKGDPRRLPVGGRCGLDYDVAGPAARQSSELASPGAIIRAGPPYEDPQ